MKRTPLLRRTPIRRVTSQHARSERVFRRHRDELLARDPRCEIGVAGCTLLGVTAHHIVPRSRGGSNDKANLLVVCAWCHQYVHEHPAEADVHGWLKPKGWL